ncbi:hypothetical protein B1748_24800 [Paenibacillus sp. MY03]|uniref:DUF5696 domain-containing protein n=1 Tax=Paenibacillus sp. MY03 TaxID=302980 RepID=UPI000B3C586F|nr:DUF5696 domain-containing protein [Paenibacillus sp. MY03]OUS72443.1 hypothetical protein B1748_24800 [Paenibacillus sp. MY03]
MFDKAIKMFDRRHWKKGTAALAAILIIISAVLWMNRPSSVVVNSDIYSTTDAMAFFSSLDVTSDVPQVESRNLDGVQWFKAYEQKKAALWFDPQTGQVAVEDKRSGKMWRSNPDSAALAMDQTKGLWRSHLESPIVLSYFNADRTLIKDTNLKEYPTTVKWHSIEEGVALMYVIEELGFQFYVEYRLEDNQLVARIPELGIIETKENLLMELNFLPFMGAAMNGSDGYLLVPDGPGGLIRFNKEGLDLINAYNYPVYGQDWSIPATTPSTRRTPVSYPVFGLNSGEEGYVAVIEEGASRANIVATPAGISTQFNEAHAKFVYRRIYSQPTGQTSSILSYEKKMPYEAVSVRYIFLDQKDADYVGMAQAYRDYLMTHRKVERLDSKLKQSPLQLQFVIGAGESTPLGEKLRVATTFKQVEEIVLSLVDQGVTNIEVGLAGWQNGGDPGNLPKRFPIEGEAGGEQELRNLIAQLGAQGIQISLNDRIDTASISRNNGFSPGDDGIQSIVGTPLIYRNAADETIYLVSPVRNIQKYVPDLIEKWKGIGIKSANLVNMGTQLNSDYHPSRKISRLQSISYSLQITDTVRQALGSVKVSGGFDFLLGHVDHMFDFPLEYNFDLIVDEQVPFYPIAVHGLVPYSSGPANLREDQAVQFLREIEYGAVPRFSLTYEDPRMLKRTSYENFFSSQYDVLEQQILAEYEVLSKTGVRNSFITGHRKLAEGVFETRYENGRKVRVNYNNDPYQGEGFTIEPMFYQVAEEEER